MLILVLCKEFVKRGILLQDFVCRPEFNAPSSPFETAALIRSFYLSCQRVEKEK
jgi:hypothetical protein